MFWCRKDANGECLGFLKRFVGGGRKVKVELRDGLMFIDEVMRIADAGGQAAAVFSSRSVALADIERVEAVG